ncbi:rhomboid family intramembrane serine protease [Aminobacter sp. AP02]|uniref:rhomboid family intramembrane serine protease n=1 Tax=Aminobacter sp. AP02 TaxID=2135737 RepID=UPI000D6C105F|nr:rhomboid family intramembrane serine protease [Aminobacter sp. AP02]PWK63318.1 membrane associated rhomboid family serine protease [Aminobacter sp. AP02]
MFIPLYDSNHLRHIRLQYVTFALIAVNVIVYLVTTLGGEEFTQATVLGLGYIPSVVHDLAELSPDLVIIPENLSYLTYSFLHGDILHLGGNMLFLWVFGDNVEDALGHFRFLVFYLLCAVAGAFLHGMILPDSETPLIGASGAIAGIVTAYLILYPRVKIWVLAFARIPLRIPAWIPLILWVVFQFAMIAIGGDDEVSWAAHVGGIIAGAVLVLVLRRRDVPLFGDAEDTAPAPDKAEAPVMPAPATPEPRTAQPPPRWGRQ